MGVAKDSKEEMQIFAYHQILDKLDALIYITDIETDEILYMSPGMKAEFCVKHPEGQICWKIFQKEMYGRCPFCPIPELKKREGSNEVISWEECNEKTGQIYENYDCFLEWPDGRTVHMQQSVNITERKELSHTANMDELTGLLNRRAGKADLEEKLRSASRERVPVTVCLSDLNNLKVINDTYGHREGDYALVSVAHIVKEYLYPEDTVFRLSGDEFIIAFYGCSLENATRKIQIIQNAMERKAAEERLTYQLSFSYGLVEAQPCDECSVMELISQADEIMYEQKQQYHIEQARRRLACSPEEERQRIRDFDYDKEHLCDALMESTDDYIFVGNMKTGTFRYSPRMVEEFGLPGTVIPNAAAVWGERIHPGDQKEFLASNQEIADGRAESHCIQYRARNRNDEWNWLQCRGYMIRDNLGEPNLFAGMITNIREKNWKKERAMEELEKQVYLYRAAERGGVFTVRVDTGFTLVYGNDIFYQILEETKENVTRIAHNKMSFYVHPEDFSVPENAVSASLKAKDMRTEWQMRIVTGKRSVRYVLITGIFAERDGQLQLDGFVLDITRNRAREKQIEEVNRKLKYSLHHDPLTAIYNQEGFYQNVRQRLSESPDRRYMIARWNVEKFKAINELLGREEGDHILKFIAEYLEVHMGAEGICARMSGDNFAVFYEENTWDIDQGLLDIQKLIARKHPQYKFAIYAGVYRITDSSVPIDQMCDRAFLALQTVKGNYLQHVAYYDELLRVRMLGEQQLLNGMDRALAAGEFEIYIQPVIETCTGKCVGGEVLVRWNHPALGLLSPDRFISLFEKNGFIVRMDAYIWDRACRCLKEWREEGWNIVPLSVNMSRLNFYQPDIASVVMEIVDRYELDPEMLKLEITESAYTENPRELIQSVERFKAYGFEIMMDDFGSGYSSLNFLQEVPIDILKVDKSFVHHSMDSAMARHVLISVVSMVRDMDMQVVAEGVETEEQFTCLKDMQCDYMQGYYFSRPIPADSFKQRYLIKEN